jgi:hypothetical protein
MVDVTGDGLRRTLVYTARALRGRNAGARPGVFALRRDAEGRWHRRTIDDQLPHPLHVDVGQLSADKPGRDLVVGGFNMATVATYRFDGRWVKGELTPPAFSDKPVRKVWNVKTIPLPDQRRDAVLAVCEAGGASALVLWRWRAGRYRGHVVKRFAYSHAMEDRIVWRDMRGDAKPELIIADSGGDQLRVYQLRSSRN